MVDGRVWWLEMLAVVLVIVVEFIVLCMLRII
jgi:hypothetical protein